MTIVIEMLLASCACGVVVAIFTIIGMFFTEENTNNVVAVTFGLGFVGSFILAILFMVKLFPPDSSLFILAGLVALFVNGAVMVVSSLAFIAILARVKKFLLY